MHRTEDMKYQNLASASMNEVFDRTKSCVGKGGHVGIYKLEITTDLIMGHRVYRSNVMVQHIPDIQTSTLSPVGAQTMAGSDGTATMLWWSSGSLKTAAFSPCCVLIGGEA
jgi:hypothetical protein